MNMKRLDEMQDECIGFVNETLPIIEKYSRSNDEAIMLACSLLIYHIGIAKGFLVEDYNVDNIDEDADAIADEIMPVVAELCEWDLTDNIKGEDNGQFND